MTAIDFTVLDWVQAHLRCGFLDTVMPIVTALGELGAVWILLCLLLLIRRDTRRAGVAMAIALALDVLFCNVILKNLIARPRPFALRPEVPLLIRPPAGFSFPSGHAAASFAGAGAMLFTKQRGRWIALVLAAAIALSRIYLYVHYPSDVVCGALLGLLCGSLGAAFAGKWPSSCKTPEN